MVKTYFPRFLFWLSGETSSSIQRSDVTGQRKTTLIKIATKQLKTLSIDREEKRLFWVQFGPRGESAVSSCDFHGNNVHIIDHPLQWAHSSYFLSTLTRNISILRSGQLSFHRSQSLGIAVFLQNLYYTDAASRVIKKINKSTGGEAVNVNLKPMAKAPIDIKVVHFLSQPMADTPSSIPG